MAPGPLQTYAVIGGTGFLGKWIVDELLGRGEKHVRVLDIRPPAVPDERVQFVQGESQLKRHR